MEQEYLHPNVTSPSKKIVEGLKTDSRDIQCPNCRRTYSIGLADGGKEIRFLNMVTWNCPRCGRHNITPFLNDEER
ncbi:MAG: hypothetical protein NVSMB44_37540 [Ktedonobacteraceae bacterium]